MDYRTVAKLLLNDAPYLAVQGVGICNITQLAHFLEQSLPSVAVPSSPAVTGRVAVSSVYRNWGATQEYRWHIGEVQSDGTVLIRHTLHETPTVRWAASGGPEHDRQIVAKYMTDDRDLESIIGDMTVRLGVNDLFTEPYKVERQQVEHEQKSSRRSTRKTAIKPETSSISEEIGSAIEDEVSK